MDKEILTTYKEAFNYTNDLRKLLEQYSCIDYAEWLINYKSRAGAFQILAFIYGEEYAQEMLCEANQCINTIERKLLIGEKIPETEVTKRFEAIVKKNLGL